MEHNVYLDPHRSFIVVNDGPLGMEPVSNDDLSMVTIDPKAPYASWAWSSGINWYFIIGPNWIALFNIHCQTGILSRKKSADLIRRFLDEPKTLCRLWAPQ
jgi:hypothetical protein